MLDHSVTRISYRKMENREELPERAASAHVTRMCGSIEPGADPKYEIVQQSSSYGTLSERAGGWSAGEGGGGGGVETWA